MQDQLAWEEWAAVWEVACSKLSGIVPYLIPDVCTDLFLFVEMGYYNHNLSAPLTF